MRARVCSVYRNGVDLLRTFIRFWVSGVALSSYAGQAHLRYSYGGQARLLSIERHRGKMGPSVLFIQLIDLKCRK